MGYPRKKPSTASQRPENSAELIVERCAGLFVLV